MSHYRYNYSLSQHTFEIHYEEGALPDVFPKTLTRVIRAAQAAAKTITQKSAEDMDTEVIAPEEETAPEKSNPPKFHWKIPMRGDEIKSFYL